MFDRILKSLETPGCFVDLAVIDFRKAFYLLFRFSACLNKSMGQWRQTLTIVLYLDGIMSGRQQKTFTIHEKDTNSDWSNITCGATQGTKLAGIAFLAMINYIFSEHKDRCKFVDD